METQGIFNKPMVKWGLYLGGLNIIYLLVLYMIDISLIVSMWNSLISLVLIIVFMVLGTKEERKNNNEVLPYGHAVVTALVIGVIASIIGVIFNVVLYTVIDPSLPETLKAVTIEKTAASMEKWGVPESDIEEAIENLERKDFSQNLRSSLTALLISSIMTAIIALIVAAFVKKEAPIFEEEYDA